MLPKWAWLNSFIQYIFIVQLLGTKTLAGSSSPVIGERGEGMGTGVLGWVRVAEAAGEAFFRLLK